MDLPCYFIFSHPHQVSAPLLSLWEAGDSGPLLILISPLTNQSQRREVVIIIYHHHGRFFSYCERVFVMISVVLLVISECLFILFKAHRVASLPTKHAGHMN